MKRIIFYLLAGIGLIATGCSQNTYSRLRDQEDKLIANYINRNNFVILQEEPAVDHIWEEKEYYKVKGYDNLYFHLISRGDSMRINGTDTVSAKILTNDIIIARLRECSMACSGSVDEISGLAMRDYRTQQVGFHRRTDLGDTVRIYPENQSKTII